MFVTRSESWKARIELCRGRCVWGWIKQIGGALYSPKISGLQVFVRESITGAIRASFHFSTPLWGSRLNWTGHDMKRWFFNSRLGDNGSVLERSLTFCNKTNYSVKKKNKSYKIRISSDLVFISLFFFFFFPMPEQGKISKVYFHLSSLKSYCRQSLNIIYLPTILSSGGFSVALVRMNFVTSLLTWLMCLVVFLDLVVGGRGVVIREDVVTVKKCKTILQPWKRLV